MADLTNKSILSVCATVSSKVKDLVIKDGQLIFVHDSNRIALDFGGKRTFYNQIITLDSEVERESILAPITGNYYFVVDTAVLWTFTNEWVQLTTPPEEIVFIGTELPELGSAQTLYVDADGREISIWNETENKYVKVANYTASMSTDDIDAVFN